MIPRFLAVLLFCVFALPAAAQAVGAVQRDPLATLLEREYVAHWIVCGPFTPDAEGGLLAAVAAGRAPLGNTDFLAERGGPTKIRPQHLDIIETSQGDAVWQRAGARDFTLDLSPFYPSAREGVTYAGFYTRAEQAQTAYIDLQTPLGARVWLNGYLLRDVRAAPLAALGRDQFLAPFRAGENFFLIETPGAAFEELAMALGMTERELGARGLVSRPLLQGKSGFEIALRIRPAQPLGDVAVVPRLAPQGTFSGGASAPRQDFGLTVFNNATSGSAPLSATVRTQDSGGTPLFVNIGSVGGKQAVETRLGVPLGSLPEGQALALEVTVTDGVLTSTFTQNIQREAIAEPGKVHVLTGPHWLAAGTRWPHESAWADAAQRQFLQARNDANYGVVLGPVAVWEAGMLAQPGALGAARAQVLSGQSSAEMAYAAADPRLVSAELWYRNLLLGRQLARTVLDDLEPALLPWYPGGLPAQTPQLAQRMGAPGVLTALDVPGVPELSQWLGPSGASTWLRRKEPARGPLGLSELRQMVSVQRRELLQRGINTDVLVDEAATVPPEPFLLGNTEELARSVPSILVRGSGVSSFFDALRAEPLEVTGALPRGAWSFDESGPAVLRRDDGLQLAQVRAQNLLAVARRLAPLAALHGGDYPAVALNQAERVLLYLAAYGAPARDEDAYSDALSETRQAAAFAAEVIDAAASTLADGVDTLSGAPVETTGVLPVVVFNASSFPRTDSCHAEVRLPARGSVRMIDDEGAEVPLVFGASRAVDTTTRSGSIAFVAKDVPGVGHRTYYLVPTANPPKAEQRPDLLIENECFEVAVDRATGNIERVTDKARGRDVLNGPGNALALIPEDPQARRNPNGIATTGSPRRPEGTPEFRTTVLPAMQEISVRQAFAGGTVERVVRLRAGLGRVEFETRLVGGAPDGLVAASFALGGAQQVTVGGAPFGAVVRSASDAAMEQRTGTNAGLFPAQQWVARAPGEQVQVGTEGGIPLAPTVIVHGPALPLRDAANTLAAALAKRGVPVKVLPAEISKPDFLWSDSLEFESHEEAWARGARMRIVIGSPEQNPLCSTIIQAQSPETIAYLAGRAPQGLVAYVEDARVSGQAPMPTLLVLGASAERSAALVPALAREIEARGTFTLPASAYVPREVPRTPEHGAALLFEGTLNAAADNNGTTMILLAQGDAATASRHADVWRYALVPVDGVWTNAALSQAGEAFNLPFVARATALHGGVLRPRAAQVALDVPGALITGIYPGTSGDPRDAMILRVCNPGPVARQGFLRTAMAIRQFAATTADELADTSIPAEGMQAAISLPGFAIQTYAVAVAQPSGGRLAAVPAPRLPKAKPPVHVPYWQHRTAPPYGDTPPVMLSIDGPLNESVASVRVRASGIGIREAVDAVITLTASEGLSVSPAQLYVNLEPGIAVEKEVAVLWSGPAQPGSGVAAAISVGGESHRAVLAYQPADLKVEARRVGAQVRVKITNPNALAVEGFVDCIAPPAFWPELLWGEGGRLTPRRAPISVPAYESVDVDFALSEAVGAPPLRVKAAANGRVVYAAVEEAPATPAAKAEPNANTPKEVPVSPAPALPTLPPSVVPPGPRSAPPAVSREP